MNNTYYKLDKWTNKLAMRVATCEYKNGNATFYMLRKRGK